MGRSRRAFLARRDVAVARLITLGVDWTASFAFKGPPRDVAFGQLGYRTVAPHAVGVMEAQRARYARGLISGGARARREVA
jgi:hypothetical protein